MIPLLNEVYDGEKVSTCRDINFSSSTSCSKKSSAISHLNLNSDSLPDYSFLDSTIGSQQTSEK